MNIILSKKFKITFIRSLIIFTIINLHVNIYAQVSEEYTLKASYLERFSRFIEWPDNPADTSVAYIVSVIGQNPFKDNIEKSFKNAKINNKLIITRFLKDISEISEPQILFITKSMKNEVSKIIDITKGKPILTIGDTEGFAERGVLINFIIERKILHFEINLQAVNDSGLKIDPYLLDYANIVKSSRNPDDRY